MNVLGLIPARGGSKSIPHKNIANLAGRPLLSYTCEAALASRRIGRVVLSTDDENIARIGRDCSVEVPFTRPRELAQDDTPSLPVAEHALDWLSKEGWSADVVVLLQPTSPFRQAKHIDEALDQMDELDADTVVSVMEVPHRLNPYSLMELQEGWLRDFCPAPGSFDRFNRHSLPKLFARNGPAVLATRVQVIFGQGSFYGSRVAAYVMSQEDSLDIDTSFDLQIAEWMMAERIAQSPIRTEFGS